MTESSILAKNLERLEKDLLKMGHLVEKMMKMAIQALREQETDLALQVIELDDQIDNLQIVIEEEIEQIALQMPIHSFDLRRYFATIKMVNDLERIGDYACNIAEIVLELKHQTYIKPLEHIPQLADLAIKMVTTALQAFITKDADLAEAVCKKDDEADDLYDEIREELINLTSEAANAQKAYQSSRFLLVAEWLERAADHATNIGEETIYIYTGKRVKY